MLQAGQPQDHTGGDKVEGRQSEREGNGAGIEAAYGRIQQPLPDVPRKLVASIFGFGQILFWFSENPFRKFMCRKARTGRTILKKGFVLNFNESLCAKNTRKSTRS